MIVKGKRCNYRLPIYSYLLSGSHVNGFTDEFKVIGYTTFKVYDNASDNSVRYYANEYMNGQKVYDYAMIKFVSGDGTVATCPAMILGFVQYNITLGIPTPQLQVKKSYH